MEKAGHFWGLRMKLLIAALLLLVVALGWLLNIEKTTSQTLRDDIQKLSANLADKSKRENFELQEKCAKQAEKTYRELGYELNNGRESLQSHYNENLNKCFMTVDSVDFKTAPGKMFFNRLLIDAYEQRGYAEYTKITTKDKASKDKKWDEVLATCSLTPLTADAITCKSDEEYMTYVRRHME